MSFSFLDPSCCGRHTSIQNDASLDANVNPRTCRCSYAANETVLGLVPAYAILPELVANLALSLWNISMAC